MSSLIQFFGAEKVDLVKSAHEDYEHGEIDTAELERRLEFLAELEMEARGLTS